MIIKNVYPPPQIKFLATPLVLAIIHCTMCVIEKRFRVLVVAAVIALLLAKEPDRLYIQQKLFQ